MGYIPNLLPENSKVNLGLTYPKESQKQGPKNSNLLDGISYIAAIGCLVAALLSFFPMPPLGLLFALMGLILLPPIHSWLERTLRFRFTWTIKIVVLIVLLVPSLLLSAVTINKAQKIAIEKQQTKEKEEKEKAEKDQQAKIRTDKAEKSRKDSLAFYETKADAQFKKNNYLSGIGYLNKALKFAQPSDQTSIYNRRALNYYKAGKYDNAIADYSKLIKDGYDHQEMYYRRALCYQKKNKRKETVADLKVAMEAGNDDAEKLYNKLNPIKRRVTGYHTVCCDGSTSYSTGRGTCSHHGGVCGREAEYEEYRDYE